MPWGPFAPAPEQAPRGQDFSFMKVDLFVCSRLRIEGNQDLVAKVGSGVGIEGLLLRGKVVEIT